MFTKTCEPIQQIQIVFLRAKQKWVWEGGEDSWEWAARSQDAANRLALKTCSIVYLLQSRSNDERHKKNKKKTSVLRDLKDSNQASTDWREQARAKRQQHPGDVKGGTQSQLVSAYVTLNNAALQTVDRGNLAKPPLALHSQDARESCGAEPESSSPALRAAAAKVTNTTAHSLWIHVNQQTTSWRNVIEMSLMDSDCN